MKLTKSPKARRAQKIPRRSNPPSIPAEPPPVQHKPETEVLKDVIAALRAQVARDTDERSLLAANLTVQSENSARLRAVLRRVRETLPGASKLIIYEEMIAQMQAVVRAHVPRGSTVAVVNKGDERLLVHDVDAWHFPRQADGAYTWHYPADSSAAIIHLEALRSAGADFLLLPRTAFWWLEHYPMFRSHLEQRFQVVKRGEPCVLFDLRRPKPRPPFARSAAASAGSALVIIPGSVNYFYDQIGHRLGEALEQLGHRVTVCTLAEADVAQAQWCFLVNPYEITYGHGERDEAIAHLSALRQRCEHTAAVLLECANTPWFKQSLEVCHGAGIEKFLDLGFHGQHEEIDDTLRPRYHFAFNGLTRRERDSLTNAPRGGDRPIPWVFVGHAAEKRVQFVRQLMRADPRGFLYMPRLGPIQRDGPHLNEEQMLAVLRRSRCQIWCAHHEHFYLESERFRSSLLTGALPLKIMPQVPRQRPFLPFQYLLVEQGGFEEAWAKLNADALWERFVADFTVLPLLEESLEEAMGTIVKRAAGKEDVHAS